MSFPAEHTLLDLDDLEDGEDIYRVLAEVRCETSWCRAKRRSRLKTKHYTGPLIYRDCGDKNGDYTGLVHTNRVERARALLAAASPVEEES